MNVVFVADYFVVSVRPPIVFSDIENEDLVIDEAAEWFANESGIDLLSVTFDQYVEEN